MNNTLKADSKVKKDAQKLGNLVIKWVSRPNKKKYAYRHTCPFILLPYMGIYPFNSLLNFLEQFCHPLPNELDHCALESCSNPKLTYQLSQRKCSQIKWKLLQILRLYISNPITKFYVNEQTYLADRSIWNLWPVLDMSGLFQDILDSLLETDPNAGKMYTATILGSTSPRGIFGTRMWEP